MSNFIANQLTALDAASAAKYSTHVYALHTLFPSASTFGDLLAQAAKAAAGSHGSVGLLMSTLIEDRHLIETLLDSNGAHAATVDAESLIKKYKPLIIDVFSRLADDYTLVYTPKA